MFIVLTTFIGTESTNLPYPEGASVSVIITLSVPTSEIGIVSNVYSPVVPLSVTFLFVLFTVAVNVAPDSLAFVSLSTFTIVKS